MVCNGISEESEVEGDETNPQRTFPKPVNMYPIRYKKASDRLRMMRKMIKSLREVQGDARHVQRANSGQALVVWILTTS